MKHCIRLLILLMLTAAVGLCGVGCTEHEDSGDDDNAAETTPLKVMSWNILNPTWGGTPATDRSGDFYHVLSSSAPDVIGLQEASRAWHDTFSELPAPYIPLCHQSNSGNDNMTMFFYNSETLSAVESGVIDLDAKSDIRVVSWAVFEQLATGKRFLITNTHPDSREAQCLAHTTQYLEIVDRLYTEKNLPMLNVGDFNAIESSAAYQLHIDAGFTDCKYAPGVSLVNDVDSYLLGDFGGKVTIGQGSRDHIFFKGAVTPITFDTLCSLTERAVSDHLPVLAYVTLGE